MAPEIL
jgi:serine/threonine protein kinase